jgi:hypothetical protein
MFLLARRDVKNTEPFNVCNQTTRNTVSNFARPRNGRLGVTRSLSDMCRGEPARVVGDDVPRTCMGGSAGGIRANFLARHADE